MPAPEQSTTQQNALRAPDAVADMQERLVQFSRLVGQVRDKLPEQHAEALSRIEQGIAGLSERIAALGQETQRPAPPAASVRADVEEWDPQSAEELMRAYETAEAEFAGLGPQARAPNVREWPREVDAQSIASLDQAWLETRLADLAATLQRSLADIDPTPSLAALDRRLDLFDRRLDKALSDMAPSVDQADLKLIGAHVTELAEHFETVRQQLTRLDTVDAQLRALAHALENAQQRSGTDAAAVSEDAIVALIDSAAERAASRVAASLAADAVGPARIDALEGMLQDYIAERRRSEETSTGVLRTIEDALVRIIDRVETMGAVGSAAEMTADSHLADRDGLDVESDRLAEAYAVGARVLGQPVSAPSLHAADYITAGSRDRGEKLAEAALPASSEAPAPQEEQMRQDLRASAIRAKLKAQAAPQAPAAEGTGPNEAGMLGHGRARSWTSARAGSHRFSLLLGAAMALLFGAGFMTVDSFLTSAPSTGAQHKAAASQADSAQSGSLKPPSPQHGDLDPQPAAQPGNADPSRPSGDRKVEPAPAPEPGADDRGESQPAPTRRLNRLQVGVAATPTTGATPVVLSGQEGIGTSAAANDGTRATGVIEGELHPALGTAKLRQAAAAGDALAQFEIATRFAEGKGVAQDHKQAFAWYERAATRGLAPAQFRLAAYFERGIGVAPDRERARVWYQRAAEQGHVRAMHNLGVLNVGAGGSQADYAAAAAWFRHAAERGLADSQFNLAVLHENGRGVAKDLQEAYLWFALAARTGDPESARRLEQVKARLEPAEIEAAEQKLAAWQPVETDTLADAGSAGSTR